MIPVDPKPEDVKPTWERRVLAQNQPQYVPLPVLFDRQRTEVPMISEWELEDHEILALFTQITAFYRERDRGATPGAVERPRISLCTWTFGQPFQPVQLVVGRFADPYRAPGPPDPPPSTYRPVG